MQLDTDTINGFLCSGNSSQYRYLMAEMDKMQDMADHMSGKHIPIPLTVALMAELIRKAEIAWQRRKVE
jgi:hypothetical protein